MKAVLDYYFKYRLYFTGIDYSDKLNHLSFFYDEIISIQTITHYCQHRKNMGVKNTTINRELNIIRSAINFYNKHHEANIKNPFNGFKLFETEFFPRYLTLSECKNLVCHAKAYPNPYFYAYIALLLNTGSRSGEILSLDWDMIDLSRKIMTIKNSLSKNKKTQHKPLNQAALDALHSIKNHDTIVFYNEVKYARYKTFRRAWLDTTQKANLQGIRIHDLRHTFASLLIEQGIPIYHISTLLGHSDIRITQRYAHLSNQTLHNVVGLLPTF